MIAHIARHKIIYWCLGINAALLLGGGLWAYAALASIPQPLIIHFNGIVGIDQIGSLRDIGAILGVGALFALVDFFIALECDARDKRLSRFVSFASVFFVLLIFIDIALIIRANV